MNKTEFISLLAKRADMPKTKCETFLNQFKATILEVCFRGEEISLRDFGKFSLQEKKARKFLNPQTKRYYMSSPKKMIAFKGFKNFVYNVK